MSRSAAVRYRLVNQRGERVAYEDVRYLRNLEVRAGSVEVDTESDIITMTYIWDDPELGE